MPIYEYRCGACGHHVEALQKMSDGALRKCPACGKSQLKRLVSASRFRLKGSGWYETDFKNKSETQRNLVEHAGTDSGETASDKSTDAAAKDDATSGKAVAGEKSSGAAEKPAKDPAKNPAKKPGTAKPAVHKSASKSRSKAARG
jgi:putative FmdB family regulatory protein